jgi:hypothetical protein
VITSYGAVEFNHKRHVTLKLPCTYCHAGALTKERAGFPAVKTCQGCHPSIDAKPLPAHHVYTVPDFVFFSHAKHAAANINCAACHGNMTKGVKMNMMWCVTCHKSSTAPVTCTVCHELSQ